MSKPALFMTCAIAFGISGIVASAEQVPQTRADQTGKSVNSTVNEVRSLFEPSQFMIVDVNDKFLIKTVSDQQKTQFRLAVLDGAREKIGTCANASKLKDGEPRTTWLQISYSKPDALGKRDFTVQRTLDFSRHDRVYRFSTGANNAYQILEPGISFRLSGDVLTYEQTTGPIGASGKTKALRLTHTLTDRAGEISSSVEMDRALWKVAATNTISSEAPILSVNDQAIEPLVSGTKVTAQVQPVIAQPLEGPGIEAGSDAWIWNVGGKSSTGVDDLSIEDEDADVCYAIKCSQPFECAAMGSQCWCHYTQPTPLEGICLN